MARGGVVEAQDRFAPEARSAVLDAAAELFDQAGYHHTTLGSIAERAGISKSAVIAMFPVKHDILHAIHDAWIDDLLAMSHSSLHTAPTVCDAIRSCFHDILAVIEARPAQVRVYFEHYRDLPPDQQKMAKAKRDLYEAQVEGVIRRGIESGVFRAQNARIATFGLFGMTNWAYQWFRVDGVLSADDVAAQLSSLFLRGLCADPEESADE